MKDKTYAIWMEDGAVVYGYSLRFRKWSFRFPGNQEMLVACRGTQQADKVAKLIAGSFKRCGKVDGSARSNINRVIGE